MHYAPTNELAKGPKQHQGIRQYKMGCCLIIKNVPFNVVVSISSENRDTYEFTYFFLGTGYHFKN